MIVDISSLGRESYLRNQNLVTSSDARLYSLALLVQTTRSNSDDFCLIELLDCALGKEDTASSSGFGLDALNEDTVEEGSD